MLPNLFRLAPLLLLSSTLSAADAALECAVVEDGQKIIRCTFHAERIATERDVTFVWHSARTPHDDRERTVVMQANHGSVYDFRYYYGRAGGDWDVSVKDEDDRVLARTSFIIEH